MQKPNGYLIYEGPSMLDGQPIIGVATLASSNIKTGNMAQLWILRADMHPSEALKSQADASICGGCPHRQSLGGACYVTVHRAPAQVWKQYRAGRYPSDWDPEAFTGRKVRLGAYGDPAALPAPIIERLVSKARGWTGYTHQTRHPNFQKELLQWVMVSVDTPRQALKAHSQGLRTFRVRTTDSPLLDGEVVCLSEQGVSCIECGLCNGQGEGPSIVIDVHGQLANRYVRDFQRINVLQV